MEQELNNKKKISIAVPFQQHSFRAAKGFIENNVLDAYYTSVYNTEKGIYKVLRIVLPKDLKLRMNGRKDNVITSYVHVFEKTRGLLYIASGKFKFLKKYGYKIRYSLFYHFGKKVARDICNSNADVVLCYDTQAYDVFLNLNKYNSSVIKVLDMASTTAQKIREIVDEEMRLNHPFSTSLVRHDCQYTAEKCEEYLKEMQMADYFLVPSNFVADCIKELGFEKNKILYLAHGVDIHKFTMKEAKEKTAGEKITFLFVGRAETAKGIYYALEAFRQLRGISAELIIVGDTMGIEDELKSYTDNVRFLGLKRRDEMPRIYQEADVFLLTSLWEGSSLSMLEAMASGLPVIASKYSCAPEVVTENEGIVIEPRNIEEIKNSVLWYVANSTKIPSMAVAARKKSEELSWDNYSKNIVKLFNDFK